MDGVDQARKMRGIDLLAQRRHVEVDGIWQGFFVLKHALEDHFAVENVSRVPGQGDEKRELALGQANLLAAPGDGVVRGVDAEIGDFDDLGLLVGFAAFQGAESGEEFLEGKGFGEVVIGSRVEPFDFVIDAVEGGQHDDRGRDTGLAEGSTDLEPGHAGEHHVEEDDGVGFVEGESEARFAIVGDVGMVSLLAKRAFQLAGDDQVILDNQESHTLGVLWVGVVSFL